MTEPISENLPALVTEPNRVTQLVQTLDINERSRIITFGDNAQRKVADFAERVLEQTQNKEIGKTGELLSSVLAKARGLDPSSLRNAGFLQRMFSSMETRIRRFREKFQDVASQIDYVLLDLEGNRETLRRDIALLDELHDETKESIIELDAYIKAGKQFVEVFQNDRLVELKEKADTNANTSDGILAAQNYQDALQSLDRLEKRLFYLEQARQIGIQQLAQIRIVQSGDETLIENLQATISLTIPVWKQKMILLLGLNRQEAALDLQKTVTDATNEMLRQASSMMKSQSIEIEKQSQRGIIDIETLEKTNRDLVDMITGVMRIQSEGRQKRTKVEQRMRKLNEDLKTAMSQAPLLEEARS